MVQRLNAAQTRQVIEDLAPKVFTRYTHLPRPPSVEAISGTCARIADAPIGRSYGMFDDSLQATGFLIGYVMPDMVTGSLTGMGHLWWSVPGVDGFPLLEQFESDCREEGCEAVICGFSEYVYPKQMARLYRRRGYKPHSVSVIKIF